MLEKITAKQKCRKKKSKNLKPTFFKGKNLYSTICYSRKKNKNIMIRKILLIQEENET
jgi:hypothetical protein